MRPSPLLLTALLALTGPLPAQAATGFVQGLAVRVPTGEPLPGILVRITQTRLGVDRVALTDGQGRFQALLLPPETYTLEVASPGETAPALQVSVTAGQPSKAVLWVKPLPERRAG